MMEVADRNYSSTSEFDTSSDSDWLDISSRASEDNDSIASFYDSDREDIYDRPASRRSLSSLTSSRSGVVDGWEGLIDDADDATPVTSLGPTPFGGNVVRPASPAAEEDPEEERVKAGLEQSMMSTLSSPRSNSLANSMQTSIVRSTRDLRLSFPDPLTSSRDHSPHSSSFEDISSPKEDEVSLNHGKAEAEPAPSSALVSADPGPASTPEVPSSTASGSQRPHVPSGITPDFFIALYGSSSAIKDVVIDALLQKWASGAGLILSCSLLHATSVTTRVYIPSDGIDRDHASRRFVSIVDKTDMNHSNPTEPSSVCPSLAVVLLPSMPSISLGMHTLYLPVAVPNSLTLVDVFPSTDSLLDAEQQWESLGIPSDKLTDLSSWSTAVVDQETLEASSPAQVYSAFRPLLKFQKSPQKRVFSTHAILLAILSMVLGYIVKGTVISSFVPMRSWGAVPINRSVTMSSTMSLATRLPNSVVIPPSSNDMQVALMNSVTAATTAPRQAATGTPHASTSAAVHTIPMADAHASECTCGCGMVTWSGKIISTDLIIRPAASALSIGSAQSKVLPSVPRGYTRKGKGRATSFEVPDASLYALSTRIAGSISEYLELDFKQILGVTKKDMLELMQAVQVLYDAIERQTLAAVEQSKASLNKLKNDVRETVKARNVRAKTKAKELKEKGRQYLSGVREHIKSRTDLAREHARALKRSIQAGELKERKAKRGEARQLKRLLRREQRHFKRAFRVY